jgi:hypothetical protein
MPAASRQLRSPKKGMVVVVAQEFAKVPGLHHWAVPSRPLPIIGTVTATTPGSETVTINGWRMRQETGSLTREWS